MDIGDHVWAAVAGVVGTTPQDPRRQAIRAAHVSARFFWRQCLKEATEYPWCLSLGDIDEHMDNLASLPDSPAQPVAGVIYDWCGFGLAGHT